MSGKYRWAIYLMLAAAGLAQAPARISGTVNLRQTVRLPGNTVWRAHAAVDEGPAPPGLELQHMLLLLRRSPAQAAELRQLLAEQRTAASPDYHHWLTPQQFGERFGPAAGDVAAVEQWLAAQGFTVDGVSPGGLVIDFSGTAATVRQALHTSMHRYQAQRPGGGVQQYWANANDPAIPAALAPVVAGVVSLNNFVARPAIQVVGEGSGRVATVLDPSPELNFNYGGENLHALVPGDFSVIYNVGPLAAQGITGSKQTIAIVARSDIGDLDVSEFRSLFEPGAAGTFQIVHATASDPGIATNGDQDEATLDAEWAGAAAPGATIDLVVGASSASTDGVTLSALYIVDHDLAPILSASYGLCEAQMTASGNEFFNDLWEQAAAEGITVLVSAGDNGAAGCDDPSEKAAQDGLAVSGFASTPYDTAVGGTQFNEGSNTTAYWGSTRPSDYSSALEYIPEQPWDEIGDGQGGTGISAGSGGASSVYARPYWQAAPGVAALGGSARLLPDLSFNASAGHDPYVICLSSSCAVGSDGSFHFYVVGGTSASAPSFAGVMALVDQKTGSPQGLANPVLYRLASSSGVFHDVTVGSNDVPCAAGSPDCPTSGELGFSAAAGYDEATGLGSANVTNLVNGWSSIKFAASTTALTLTPPANATVGQSVPLNISVTGGGSGPAPTGIVDLLAQFSDGSEEAVGSFTLSSGGTLASSTAGLPGGTYNVVANYEGDANYGPSTSAPVSVTLAKITPTVTMEFYTSDPSKPVASVLYGDPVTEQVVVSGPAGSVLATGSVTLNPLPQGFFPGGSVPLDPTGSETLSSTPPFAQTYKYTATYTGDRNYNTATSTVVSLTVNPSPTTVSISAGASDTINIVLEAQGQAALGEQFVQIYNGSSSVGPAEVSGSQVDAATGMERAEGTFTLPPLPGLSATISAKFSGTNYVASSSNVLTVPTPAHPVFSPVQLTFPPEPYGQTSPTQTATLTNQGAESLALKPFASAAPFTVSSDCPATLASGQSCTVSVAFAPTPASTSFPIINQSIGIAAASGGFLAGLELQGTVQTFTLFGGGFMPTVSPGQSGTYTVIVTPYGDFTGAVTLGCSNLPPFAACSFSPATLTPDGKNQATATLTVTTKAPPAAASFAGVGWPLDWLRLLLALMALAAATAATMLAATRRRRAAACSGGLTLALLLLAACGGSAASVTVPPPPPPSSQQNPSGTIMPSSLTFGVVGVGETSSTVNATLYSNGNVPLQISGISFTTGNAADFHETNNCGSSVAPNTNCTISVTFAPSQGAAEQSQLTVAANTTLKSVGVSGTGVTSTPPGVYSFKVTGTTPGQPVVSAQDVLNVTASAAAGAGRGAQERASPRRR